ncbi:MAG: type II secretion system F family protein [Coriobacteriaceae bacterium]
MSAYGTWLASKVSESPGFAGVAPRGFGRPVAERSCREPVRRYVLWARMALEQRGYASTSDALLSLVLGACLALLVAGWVVAASPVFGAAVAGCALVALCAAVKSDAERREAALRDEIPDALRSLGVCFRAGLSLMQTLEQTGSEMKGPLGELFLSAALVLQTGGTASEALALFRQRADVPELAFVAVALDVQHQSGGSLAAVLDAARESGKARSTLLAPSRCRRVGPAVGAHRHGDAVRASPCSRLLAPVSSRRSSRAWRVWLFWRRLWSCRWPASSWCIGCWTRAGGGRDGCKLGAGSGGGRCGRLGGAARRYGLAHRRGMAASHSSSCGGGGRVVRAPGRLCRGGR